jgi:hypothetical protein
MRASTALAACFLASAALGAACSSESPAVTGSVVGDAGDEDSAPRRPPVDDDAGELGPTTGPLLLSETGLYSNFASRTVAGDLIAFTPRYEFWADGAKKARFLYLPPGTKIDTSRIDDFTFPVGTKAFKEFRYDGKLVETRLLMKVREGNGNKSWWQVAYVWKDDGSDAVATPLGATAVLGTAHTVPSQVDCANCHGGVSDVLLGVSAIQLSDPVTNPLMALNAAGKLSTPPPAMIDVPGTGVVKDALGYLHGNCGHCHNDESIRLNTQTRMRLRLLVSQKTPEETGAFTTTVGTVMKHALENGVTDVVVKGKPDQSGLWLRMGRRDNFGMPPAGTQTVDTVGLETVRQWIVGWP